MHSQANAAEQDTSTKLDAARATLQATSLALGKANSDKMTAVAVSRRCARTVCPPRRAARPQFEANRVSLAHWPLAAQTAQVAITSAMAEVHTAAVNYATVRPDYETF